MAIGFRQSAISKDASVTECLFSLPIAERFFRKKKLGKHPIKNT